MIVIYFVHFINQLGHASDNQIYWPKLNSITLTQTQLYWPKLNYIDPNSITSFRFSSVNNLCGFRSFWSNTLHNFFKKTPDILQVKFWLTEKCEALEIISIMTTKYKIAFVFQEVAIMDRSEGSISVAHFMNS